MAESSQTTELVVRGMNCSNCVRHVTEAISKVPGVGSALVTMPSRAVVRWSASNPRRVADVLQAIRQAGYEAAVAEARPAHAQEPQRPAWQLTLWIAVACTLPMMIGEWALHLGMNRSYQWVAMALATVVQFVSGAPFYQGAWRQLRSDNFNMDTLVALGSTTAYGFSLWIFLSGIEGHLYFMEAAAIITLISLGHWLEARITMRASSSLRRLMSLAPPTARLRLPGGAEQEVPVAELRPAQEIVLKPGDRIPTDGQVADGQSAVDESMLTGESTPIDKTFNDLLYAGTVNLTGRLVMRVTATGEATALAHIITAVQRAQASRANIQRLGDRVSGIFVPAIIIIAFAAGLWWGLAPEQARATHQAVAHFFGGWWPVHAPAEPLTAAIIIAASILIVACPCAMGIATPAAIMAGANAAAKKGILIRDGVALEKAGQVEAVIFDKTGTLTTGKLSVAQAETWSAAQGWSDEPNPEIFALAASLARPSNHPLSHAVAQLSKDEFSVADWHEVAGAGVESTWKNPQGDTVTVRLGSLKWLIQSGVDVRADNLFVTKWSDQGATVLGLASEDAVLGLFALKDTLKPGAPKAVWQLQKRGWQVYLLTGDNRRTAESIARQAGIAAENVFAEVRPEEKAYFVNKLQEQGRRIAFVGDGINDGPALEQADLGIAVSRASDIAREAADIILLNSDIEAVPESLALARATLRTIKQNLFWAFFYNALAVPFAALGLISPVLCAAAMGFSDLVVIGNALRLKHFK